MDPSRQLLRYTIPGGVLIVWFFGAELIRAVVAVRAGYATPGDRPFDAVLGTGFSPLLLIAAAPIFGFVLFQIYYVVTAIGRGWFVRVDRTRDILQPLADLPAFRAFAFSMEVSYHPTHHKLSGWPRWPWLQERALLFSLDPQHRGRHGQRTYADQCRENMYLLKLLLHAHREVPAGEAAHAEYRTLSDIYHSLGASQSAVALAALAYGGILLVADGEVSVAAAVYLLVTLSMLAVVTLVAWLFLARARHHTWATACNVIRPLLRLALEHRPLPGSSDERDW